MSDEDFSELDLRMCSLVEKGCSRSNFYKSYINKNVFFHKYFSKNFLDIDSIISFSYSPNGNGTLRNDAGFTRTGRLGILRELSSI